MKKLPIGIQTFRKIIEDNYIYIDKTKETYELIKNYQYAFLARPRRFGKSLFLDTLQEIFEANKELFKGLYIYDKWDWSKKYPVIKISWAGADFQTLEDLKSKANRIFKKNQEKLGIVCEDKNPSSCLDELIQKAYEKYNTPVVVLVDEYDKPILNVIENPKQAKVNREFIKGIYEVLKDNDKYIKFVFLTGVSKFSKASIFSGLNNLVDISLMPRFGNICGYTQKDIETTFLPYLDGVDLEKLKVWYNGYNFLKDSLYNPFDILRFIDSGFIYKNYWFSSGTPTFLVKLIKQNNYFLPKLSNLKVGGELLDSFDIEKIKLEVILYQSGYLTIDKMMIDEDLEEIEYILKLPNKEVKISLNNFIIETLFDNSQPNIYRSPLIKALKQANLKSFKDTLISIFASIPNDNYRKNDLNSYEGFYATVVYVYLQSLGLDIIGEDVTNQGRIDLTVKVEDKIYIIEFKVIENKGLKIENENSALAQIKEKKYYQKYLNPKSSTLNPKIYLVGIEFSKEEKNIVGFEWKEVNSEN